MRLQDTQCPNALNQKWLSPICEKSDTTNLRIKAKCHAHLQTLEKTYAKFLKKIWLKL